MNVNRAVTLLNALIVVLLYPGCMATVPTPSGWIGADPVLHVRPDVRAKYPALVNALRDAAREYCRRGFRCIRIAVDSYGHNEVRLGGRSGTGGRREDPRALSAVKRIGTKRILYVFEVHGHTGKPIEFVNGACKKRDGVLVASAPRTAAHEIGHVLGLDHPCEPREALAREKGRPLCGPEHNKAAVMYPTLPCDDPAEWVWPTPHALPGVID